ncbi:hypothetical protein AB4120_08020 [Cupriavidus sp. 2KB_3]|uniref:hypothetical protein n=1 Tax=Cupriavidus TaxID=106589 RepID=UPI0021CC7E10|nr:hypothetical protein [Cupriavidus campinensis]
MDESKIVDGILIVDDNDPRRCVIFNFRTWVEIIKGLMVQYAGKTEKEAASILLNSPLVENALRSYMAVGLRAHELDYHWAMLLAHGEGYWRKGIDTEEPDGYEEWDERYRKEHDLEERNFIFYDQN